MYYNAYHAHALYSAVLEVRIDEEDKIRTSTPPKPPEPMRVLFQIYQYINTSYQGINAQNLVRTD